MAEKKPKAGSSKAKQKKVTRYTYENLKEPRTPETGHTSLLPSDEQVVTLPMDNGWSKALKIGKIADDERPVVIDMDPAVDPVLMWAGKRNKREVPVLPLQRNEIVSESRISQIIERAKKAANDESGFARPGHLFADLEKSLRESERTKRVKFYSHDEGWKNKLICGDSLHVMESLLHYENLRGKVQMIYMDPPYGISYDSNFQQRIDTTKNDQRDAVDDVLTIKAFRDTWALGIHSYLSYLRDRLYLCRELLSETGSVFLQINEPNLHTVRSMMDEVFGRRNAIVTIAFKKSGSSPAATIGSRYDYLCWFAKDSDFIRPRKLYLEKSLSDVSSYRYKESPDGKLSGMSQEERRGLKPLPPGWRAVQLSNLAAEGAGNPDSDAFELHGHVYKAGTGKHWKTSHLGLRRLLEIGRLVPLGSQLNYKRYFEDFSWIEIDSTWDDTGSAGYSSADPKVYAVQTDSQVVDRCILLTTNPSDLVFDPTCGSGTTAVCAERLGRRWITCDSSRVSVNVARKRLLSGTFDHYKTRNGRVSGDFVYKEVERITLKSLANDLEPEKVKLVSEPELEKDAIRVAGPFEIMSLGRYSIDDWKGYVLDDSGTNGPNLQNYIEVICRLYRKDSAIQGASGLIHAISETSQEKIGISVGPISGRVTAKQINDAVQDAIASGILDVHVLGWAFEPNVGEVKSQLENRGRVNVELLMIRPDTLAEGLKTTQPETLFSPLALPDIEVASSNDNGECHVTVTLRGVAVFDRKTRGTDYKSADSGYVAAWYLDEDYDGDCFVDCQMFFDFKKAPNLKATLKMQIDPEEFRLEMTSQSFPIRSYKRIAVKVVDVYGNESTVVKDLA